MDEQPQAPEPNPDAWKTVVFGQASQDLVPPHPGPPETADEALVREALNDPAAESREEVGSSPTLWRVVVLLVVAVAALSVVFGLGR